MTTKPEPGAARRQIARELRLSLEAAWRSAYCRTVGLYEADFDRNWYHGLGPEGGEPSARMLVPGRRFTWDFVHRLLPLCVEVNGGQGRGSRSGHGSWSGLARDAEKALLAMVEGYWPVTFTTSQVVGEDMERQMAALLTLEERLAGRPSKT